MSASKTLEELKVEAADLKIELAGNESEGDIQELITAVSSGIKEDIPPVIQKEPVEKPKRAAVAKGEEVVTMKVSDIKNLIAQAIAESKESVPLKPKKVTEHHVHVWRLDGKWVVDFVDRNVDEYYKGKVHSFQKYNEQRREFEAWIEVKFEDGSTKELPLTRYVQNRHLMYCPLIKRHKKDVSYSMGEVEQKKEVGDLLVGTGVMIDQTVEQYETVFEVRVPVEGNPDGKVLLLPEYVIA